MSVPSSRFTANQSQPPPPTAMKSPHWWSNQASPLTASVSPSERERARRGHARPRVVVRAAGSAEVDLAVAVVQGSGLRRRGEGRGRSRACRPPTAPEADSRSIPPSPRIVHGHRPRSGPGVAAIARSKPPPSPRRLVDLGPDLGPLVVEEAVARLVGEREMRCPGHRERAALGAEDDELEAERRAVGRAEVPGVVPPLGQPIMRPRHHAGRPMGCGSTGLERRGDGGGGGTVPPAGLAGSVRRSTTATRRAAHEHRDEGLIGRRLASTRRARPRQRSSRAGIHQFQWPSSRMVAGTSSARTTVASSATAIATPRPSALIRTISANANEDATTTTMMAAEVTIRPLRSRPSPPRPVVAGPVPGLLHPRQQEHLVIHREPEEHAEEDHRLGRLDEAERLEPERRREVAVLEDPDERPEWPGSRGCS